jgi:hypothetical protein
MGGILAGAFPAISPIFSAANLGAAGIGVAARYGLQKGEEFNQWMVGQRLSGLNREINLPSDILNRRSQEFSPFRNYMQSFVNRDWSNIMAWDKTFANKSLMTSIGNVQGRTERELREKMGLGTFWGTMADVFNQGHQKAIGSGLSALLPSGPGHGIADTGRGLVQDILHPIDALVNFGRDFGQGVVGGVGTILGSISQAVMPSTDGKTARTRKEEDIKANIAVGQANDLNAAHQHELDLQDPFYQAANANVFSGFKGRYALNRATGVSAKLVRDPTTGKMIPNDYLVRQKMEERGRDWGELAGGRQTLFSIGRGYGKAFSEGSDMMLSHGEMGLQQFPQLLKLGGMLSGVVGSRNDPRGGYAFIQNAVQGIIGRGGLDPIVGQEIAGTYGEQALKAGWGANATDLIKQVASFAKYDRTDIGIESGVYDVAGQQRRLLEAKEGFGVMGKFTQGTLAPLYKAFGIQAGIRANGGKYNYNTEVLGQMAPEQIWSIARGGKRPEGFEGMISQESAKSYLTETMRRSFAELNPALIADTDIYGKKVAAALQASHGDVKKALHSRLLEKIKEGASKADLRNELQAFGTKAAALQSVVTGQGVLGLKGMEELVFSQYEDVNGAGVGVVGQTTEQKAVGKVQGETTREEGGEAVKTGDEAKAAAAETNFVKERHKRMKESLPTLTGLPEAVDDLTFALNKFKGAVVASRPSNTPQQVTGR